MSIKLEKIPPRCGNSGSDDLRMPEGVANQDDLADDSRLNCTNCGGTVVAPHLAQTMNG
jgi:ribosomal protein S27AE